MFLFGSTFPASCVFWPEYIGWVKYLIAALVACTIATASACSNPAKLANGMATRPAGINIIAECGIYKERITLNSNAEFVETYWVNSNSAGKFVDSINASLVKKGYVYKGTKQNKADEVNGIYVKGSKLTVLSAYFNLRDGLALIAIYGDK